MQAPLRQAYPGVPPWEWDDHPEWRRRVVAALRAEDEARAANGNDYRDLFVMD